MSHFQFETYTDWETNQLMTDLLTYNWMTNQLTDWLIDSQAEWMTSQLTDWPTDLPTGWLTS